MRGPAQTSEPIIQYLYQLVEALAEGKLLIPRFQRPLVWSWDRQSELLRSVKDGIPMGAIMIWRTSRTTVDWQRHLAGHPIPVPDPKVSREYLLDGLQRLSTLFGALMGRLVSDSGDIEGDLSFVGYDLDEEVFVQVRVDCPKATVIPLSVLSNSVTLLRFQRGLKGAKADTFIERSDELAKAFREYKVPVIPIASDDFEVAARTFNVINTQGVSMGEADMIHALTWSPQFELRDKLDALRSEILQPLGWGLISFDTILKVVKAEIGLDLYMESAEQLSKSVKDNPKVIDSAIDRLARVATLLGEECGVLDWELVPYEFQSVLMASALSVSPSKRLKQLMADWFWLTTYGELFAGLSGFRLTLVVKAIQGMEKSSCIEWTGPSAFKVRPMPNNSDFRAVRIKALALQLARQQSLVCQSAKSPFEVLAEHKRSAMCQLIPRRLLSKENFSSPANRFLCAPDQTAELRARVLGCNIDPLTAETHFLAPDCLLAMKKEQWNSFVEARLEALKDSEGKFISSILVRNPGVGAPPPSQPPTPLGY